MSAIPTTWRQRIVASDALPRLWLIVLPFGIGVSAVRAVGPVRDQLSDAWSALLLVVIFLLASVCGYFLAIVTAWLLFGPILMVQADRNGGPFVPGDRVQIVAGRYRNRVARVYAAGQHECVRVDLGDAERETFADIFSGYQLLRVEGDNLAEDNNSTTE